MSTATALPLTPVAPKTVHSSYVPSVSLFAQLLASERLTVRIDAAAKTASFEPVGRVLVLPSWQGFDEAAWLLFVGHEVGHALYSPADMFTRPAFKALTQIYHQNAVALVMNIVEDIRIERMVREQYRGLSGVFARGYQSLLAKDFFGPDATTMGDSWDQKNPLDQINIYAKVGALSRLTLTNATAITYFNRSLGCKTYDDVLVVVKDLMAEMTKNAQAIPQTPQPQMGQPGQGDQTGQSGQSGQSGQGESQGQGPSPSGQGASKESSKESSKDGAGQSQGPGASQGQDQGTAPDQGQSGQSGSGQGQPAQPGQGPSTPVNPFESTSAKAAEAVLNNSAVSYYNAAASLMMPTNTNFLHFNDVPLKTMLSEWEATAIDRQMLNQMVQAAKREASTVLASMIASFRANQSAWQQRRVQVSKTGSIDTGRLANYKLTEDLFLRRRSLPEAQNHGFVLHIDWSGSMDGKLVTVLWQVLHLIWFAESIRIPVDVHAFSNAGKTTAAFQKLVDEKVQQEKARGNPYYYADARITGARLLTLYQSGADAKTKMDAQSFLLGLIFRFGGVWGNSSYMKASDHLSALPKDLQKIATSYVETVIAKNQSDVCRRVNANNHGYIATGSTPLLNALVSSVDTVRAFRLQHRVEQCISVWLTDGEDTEGLTTENPLEGSDYRSQRYRSLHEASLLDPRSGKMFTVADGLPLPTLFDYHRTLTGATVVCIDITASPLSSYRRVMTRSELQEVAGRVGEQSNAPTSSYVWGRRVSRRRRGAYVKPKTLTQTRKRVIMPNTNASFDEAGLMVVTAREFDGIGADAYLVSHPDWWTDGLRPATQHSIGSTVTKSLIADDEKDDDLDADDEVLSPEDQAMEDSMRPVKLKTALTDMAQGVAMRKFAALLVPFMAAGRADGKV